MILMVFSIHYISLELDLCYVIHSCGIAYHGRHARFALWYHFKMVLEFYIHDFLGLRGFRYILKVCGRIQFNFRIGY